MADSTLSAIRIKVRRLTRSPSSSQITDAQIDEYVNTFFLYDFPEHLRTFALRTTYTFYTEAFVDTYSSQAPGNLTLNDFDNTFSTFHPPAFIAGYPALWSQSESEFFGLYPKISNIQLITNGDGITTVFNGTIPNAPFLQNKVVITSIDVNNLTLTATDLALTPSLGNLVDPQTLAVIGNVNYITGTFTVTFPTAPASGVPINSETVPYQPSRPQSILFYENKFTLRPVPDQSYPVSMEAYIKPTELLASNQSPDIQQWWQYVAYGASKKIFEDRMDLESVQLIMPEFNMQQRLVLRTTLVQQTNERTATIYTNLDGYGVGYGWGYGNGPQ